MALPARQRTYPLAARRLARRARAPLCKRSLNHALPPRSPDRRHPVPRTISPHRSRFKHNRPTPCLPLPHPMHAPCRPLRLAARPNPLPNVHYILVPLCRRPRLRCQGLPPPLGLPSAPPTHPLAAAPLPRAPRRRHPHDGQQQQHSRRVRRRRHTRRRRKAAPNLRRLHLRKRRSRSRPTAHHHAARYPNRRNMIR